MTSQQLHVPDVRTISLLATCPAIVATTATTVPCIVKSAQRSSTRSIRCTGSRYARPRDIRDDTRSTNESQRWTGTHFERVTLKSLGLRIQLGHRPGDKCYSPVKAFGDAFVVMDLHGIHEVGLDFCACASAAPTTSQLLRYRLYPATSTDPRTAATFRLLETFHLLSAQSKVSAFEFYSTLARRSDNTGTEPPKVNNGFPPIHHGLLMCASQDRYVSFLHMIRQWRHLKMLKRGGRGNVPNGATDVPQGSCAVECPACPQPGKNLPDNWKSAPEHK